MKQKTRDEIQEKDKWDLTFIFKGAKIMLVEDDKEFSYACFEGINVKADIMEDGCISSYVSIGKLLVKNLIQDKDELPQYAYLISLSDSFDLLIYDIFIFLLLSTSLQNFNICKYFSLVRILLFISNSSILSFMS